MINNWDMIADLRKDQIERGNDITFTDLFVPYYKNIFSSLPHDTILEIGCGTGHMAKYLYDHLIPQKFVILDESERMIDVAREVNRDTYIDIKKCSIFKYKSCNQFNIVFTHLCLHTIDDIDTIFNIASRIISDFGNFIFSIPHPCFYNKYKKIFDENVFNYNEESKTFFRLTITNDNKSSEPIPYIHRPLQNYLNSASKYFRKININEIYPDTQIMKKYKEKFKEPHYIVFLCQNA